MIYLWTSRTQNWCFLELKVDESDFIKFMCREYFLSPSTLTRDCDGGKIQKLDFNIDKFGLRLSYERTQYNCYQL